MTYVRDGVHLSVTQVMSSAMIADYDATVTPSGGFLLGQDIADAIYSQGNYTLARGLSTVDDAPTAIANASYLTSILSTGGTILIPPGQYRLKPSATGISWSAPDGACILSLGGPRSVIFKLADQSVGGTTLIAFSSATGGSTYWKGIDIVNTIYANTTSSHPLIVFEPRGPCVFEDCGLDGNMGSTWDISGVSKAANAVITTVNTHNLAITTYTVTGITNASSAVVTTSATHGIEVGTQVSLGNVSGMTQINGGSYRVTAVTATTLTLNVNSTGFSAYTSGGIISSSIVVAGVSGMTQINGSWALVSYTSTTLTVAVNSTGFSTYTSGGTLDGGYRNRLLLGFSLNANVPVNGVTIRGSIFRNLSFIVGFQANNNAFVKSNVLIEGNTIYNYYYEGIIINCPGAPQENVTIKNNTIYGGKTYTLFAEAPLNGDLCYTWASVHNLTMCENKGFVEDRLGHFSQVYHGEQDTTGLKFYGNYGEVSGVSDTLAYAFFQIPNNISTGVWTSPAGVVSSNVFTRVGSPGGVGYYLSETTTVATNMRAYNNEIVGAWGTGAKPGGALGIIDGVSVVFDGNTIKGATIGISTNYAGMAIRGNTTVDCGTHIQSGTTVADHLFIGSGRLARGFGLHCMLVNPRGHTGAKSISAAGIITENLFDWTNQHFIDGKVSIKWTQQYVDGSHPQCSSVLSGDFAGADTSAALIGTAYKMRYGTGFTADSITLTSTGGNLTIGVGTSRDMTQAILDWSINGTIHIGAT